MKIPTLFRPLLALVVLASLASCADVNENWKADAERPDAVHNSLQKITDVIVYDIFSPPQAARIYAYTTIAGYEAGQRGHADYVTLAGQLNELESLPAPPSDIEICYPLAASVAILKTGKALIFSEEKVDAFRDELLAEFTSVKMPEEVFDASVAYGETVSDAVLAYADKDNYKQSRTFPKFSINSDPSRWRPTPPDYMDGIEPHWKTIRPFILDSAQQFKPVPPPPFDLTEGSEFHEDLMEVYTALDEEPDKRLQVASFWDCNPFVSHHRGHVMFATKKISPGGHWMGITRDVARAEGLDVMASLNAYLRVAISLADGFISCWDEKYRSQLVRPETLINQYIDEEWQPALQTPPFPEYTSGHSVISRSAAVAMTDMFGDNYRYTDSVEVDWGLKARTYDSFFAASEEAAISRLYGGIHYAPAIWEGVKQGEQVGKLVRERLVTYKGDDAERTVMVN